MTDTSKWQCKAVSLISTLKRLRELLTPEEFEAMLHAMPERTREVMTRRLLVVEWIPYDDTQPLTNWLFEHRHHRNEQAMREQIWGIAQSEFNSIYKFLLRVMSPTYVFRNGARMYSMYNSHGQWENLLIEKRGTRMHYVNKISGHYPNELQAIALQGYSEGLQILTGAKDIHIERKNLSINESGLSCEFHGSYEI